MKLLKWILLLCAIALAAAIFHAKRMNDGLEFGRRDGAGSDLPKRQEKVTSIHFWEIGRTPKGPGGVSANPYVAE